MTEEYKERAEKFGQEAAGQEAQSNKLARFRLFAFLCILLPLFPGIWLGGGNPVWLIACCLLCLIALVSFVVLISRHAAIDEQAERLHLLKSANERALARRARRWADIPIPNAGSLREELPLSRDLDLFGFASLFQLLGTAVSPVGRETLAANLISGVPPELRELRRGAIEEMAPKIDFRQDLEVAGTGLLGENPCRHPRLPGQEQTSKLSLPVLVTRFLAYALPAGLCICVLAAALGWIPHFSWIAFLIANVVLTRLFRNKLGALLDPLSQQEGLFRNYVRMFSRISEYQADDPHLRSLIAGIGEARAAIDELEDLAIRADARGSIPHLILQNGLLWDFHTARRVQRWTDLHGARSADWFESLGEVEAVAAFAQLLADEPEWSFAEFHEATVLEAQALGHPLLTDSNRVGNDVTVGPAGTFFLVTGSNMSGKSTLLRSIGQNAILAQAGGPCCAKALRLCPVRLATSIKVEDSLDDGVSFFRAELERIKQIVDLAEESAGAASPEGGDSSGTVLFLLDEILRGTNSEERREIVARVVARLCERGAIGAITTHDLALAEVDSLRASCVLGHFQEDFQEGADGPEMSFDYELREGIAPTTNALKMMRMVGLDL